RFSRDWSSDVCSSDLVADDCNIRRMFHEQTSGTTGKPLDIWRMRGTVEGLYALAAARAEEWYGLPATARFARLGGQLVTPVRQQIGRATCREREDKVG